MQANEKSSFVGYRVLHCITLLDYLAAVLSDAQ